MAILLPPSPVSTRLKAPSREPTAGGDVGAAEQIHGRGREDRTRCCGRFPVLPNLWRGCGAEEVAGRPPGLLRWQCSRGPGSQPPPRVQSLWWMAHLASGSAIVCVCVLTAVVLLRGLFVMSLWRVAPEPPRGLEAALINSCCSILPSPAQTVRSLSLPGTNSKGCVSLSLCSSFQSSGTDFLKSLSELLPCDGRHRNDQLKPSTLRERALQWGSRSLGWLS